MGEGEAGFPTCLSTLYCLSVEINQDEKYVHGPLLLEQKGSSHLTRHSTNSRKEVEAIVAVVCRQRKQFIGGRWNQVTPDRACGHRSLCWVLLHGQPAGGRFMCYSSRRGVAVFGHCVAFLLCQRYLSFPSRTTMSTRTNTERASPVTSPACIALSTSDAI